MVRGGTNMVKHETIKRRSVGHTNGRQETRVRTAGAHSAPVSTHGGRNTEVRAAGVHPGPVSTNGVHPAVLPVTGGSTSKITMRIPVIITHNSNGFFAELPVIRGYSEGSTREEALANIRQVVHLCLMRASEECHTMTHDFYVDHVEINL